MIWSTAVIFTNCCSYSDRHPSEMPSDGREAWLKWNVFEEPWRSGLHLFWKLTGGNSCSSSRRTGPSANSCSGISSPLFTPTSSEKPEGNTVIYLEILRKCWKIDIWCIDVPVRELEDGESGFVLVATVAAYDGPPASSSVSSSLSNSLMMNQEIWPSVLHTVLSDL